ncbi:MarR family winged helix-turn-helix transcriptional regulator [Micromonospora peucetia]|uniref:DNA-binding transcriptional regulator, MarR family n=1 Tax=Micromonospora peucetia TaxID=47871 RepID=A0A1C6UCX3_9ACTN|nr:MarR family transcriptional regulator [Micromonospora peucetia]WSA33848.1 MarR family transcriptional regulator [Micromonospora peucetia]SCL51877.1 DNA-binding transcriptional regulator, MarR family [Micromonospora peucetia]
MSRDDGDGSRRKFIFHGRHIIFREIYSARVDRVTEIVHQWRRERPDVDPSPLLVIGRIQHLAEILDAALRPPFAAAGLGNGEFDVLAALRREGEPFQLTPGQLSERMLVTTGAVTKRVDRLITRGLVTRSISEADARGRVVGLTPAGVDLVNDLIEKHLANETALLRDLTAGDRTDLERLLAALTRTVESSVA